MLMALIKQWGEALFKGWRQKPSRLHTFLTFTFNGVQFGLEALHVREIVRYQILAEPTDKPTCIRGLYRYHDHMIPVIDIAARYGNEAVVPGMRTSIVIVELPIDGRRRQLGLIVDEVRSMMTLAEKELKPLPSHIAHSSFDVDIVEGLVKVENGYLIVISPQRILSRPEAQELSVFMRQLSA